MKQNDIYLDPKVWGPHFWFVMLTIAIQYPNNPNDVIKKKTFRFFTDLQDFLPNNDVRKKYSEILNQYPISPYLDSRLSLLKWVNFIHNKYNISLGKPFIELYNGLERYYENYKTDDSKISNLKKIREKYLLFGLYFSLILLGIYLYKSF